jgi:uncharacterized protein DUF5455
MPLLIAGLSWLASAIGAISSACIELFALWITKRTLVMAALTASYIALVVALFAGASAAISGITAQLPDGGQQAIGMFLPSNSYSCLAAVFAVSVTRWIYEQSVKILDYAAQS